MYFPWLNHGALWQFQVKFSIIKTSFDIPRKASVHLLRHCYISENSRKAKAARQIYESLKNKVQKDEWVTTVEWETVVGHDGIPVPQGDISKVLNLRLQDEHMSPYITTDMNLFQMHMLNESIVVVVYKAENGWLFIYDKVSDGPQPFGQNGYDTR